MKQKFVLISGIILIGFAGLFSSFQTGETRKDFAIVNMVEGYYIYVDSKPMKEYTYLGTVDGRGMSLGGSSQYVDVRNSLIKRAKKEYPRADGLIFTFVTGARDKVDAIQFKD